MRLSFVLSALLAVCLLTPWVARAQPAAPAPTAEPAPAAAPPAATPAPDSPAPLPETPPTPPTPPVSGGCLVSGFRAEALRTHDIVQREQRALAWLRANGERCTTDQLVNLGSNLGIWLGRAESVRISTIVEGLLQLSVNPDENNREQVRRAMGIPPPPPPPKPAPPVVPVNTAPPPEMARPQTQTRIFNSQRRTIARHFATWSGDAPCPGALVPVDQRCQAAPEAVRSWSYGQPLPETAQTQFLPNALLASLGDVRPGLEWALLNDDVLLVDIRSRVVRDAVLDLGRPAVKVPPPPPPTEEEQRRARARPAQTPR